MAGTDLTSDGWNERRRLKGFDEYEVRLGDLLRGERATLGKSLMDLAACQTAFLYAQDYPQSRV